ncbi:HMG-box, partial [Agrocybe pediades]
TKKKDHIPRPQNCFILFRKTYEREVLRQLEKVRVPAASKDAAAVWHAMSDEAKEYWIKEAEREKAEHKARHPNYKFQTRKRK